MKLSGLAAQSGLVPSGPDDPDILGLTADSRAVKQGMLFAALPGTRVNGNDFIRSAIEQGAGAVLTDDADAVPDNMPVSVLVADDVRRAFAKLSAAYFGRQPQQVVAITGTSGKTSVAGFLRQIWQIDGNASASIGTLGVVSDPLTIYGSLTTPDTVRLHELLSTLADNGVTHAAMEASSHGLDQRRLDGVDLTAAAFTNLGRDHLDYHANQEEYFLAKLGLFTRLLAPGRTVVLDSDEPWSKKVAEAATAKGLVTYSIGETGNDMHILSCAPDGAGQRLEVRCAGRSHHIKLPLIGRFQVSNALIAAGLAVATGVSEADALAALARLTGAPGRLEHVGDHRSGAHAFVDYAHKPDALETVLKTLRPFTRNRLIVVFGAGGDRDHGKRALMGEIAERLADIAIVTDDNPRSENPATVRAMIRSAAPSSREIGDRSEAIHTAVALLRDGDILVVAGKGHEEGQIVGNKTLPFSDRGVLVDALQIEPPGDS